MRYVSFDIWLDTFDFDKWDAILWKELSEIEKKVICEYLDIYWLFVKTLNEKKQKLFVEYMFLLHKLHEINEIINKYWNFEAKETLYDILDRFARFVEPYVIKKRDKLSEDYDNFEKKYYKGIIEYLEEHIDSLEEQRDRILNWEHENNFISDDIRKWKND